MFSAGRRRDQPSPRAIARAVEAWFGANARDLPWRGKRTGYTALVSEAMLQQTQVSRVVEKYREFMRRFPSVRDLARADEQAVLAAWQGLGYYRRARHLHAAAKAIVEEHDAEVPARAAALRRLPGVGRYTAGAIASIVFGERTPLVDGNVQRVLARVYADDRAPTDRATIDDCWSRAEQLVGASGDPGALNEGLMELGAVICAPSQPDCARCPLASLCLARKAKRERDIPPPKTPAKQRTLIHHAVLITRGDRVLLEQRPAAGLWSNMWQVPTIEAPGVLDDRALLARLTVPVTALTFAEEFPHQTTHRRITFRLYRAATRARRGCWVSFDEIDTFPLSNPQRRIVTSCRTMSSPATPRTGAARRATRSRSVRPPAR